MSIPVERNNMAMQDWNEKYRPKSLSEILGNPSAVREMARWAEEWEHKTPRKKAILLYGAAGTGKTSAALALARDMGWSVVELNASDIRNAQTIKESVAVGAVNETFTVTGEFLSSKDGGRKLIVIDEADSLYERGGGEGGGDALDHGGRRAVYDLIRDTKQPVILIVNDVYALTKDVLGAQIKKIVHMINFKRISRSTVAKRLMEMARLEEIALEPEAAEKLAGKSGGDMRASVNDLQSISIGRERVLSTDLASVGSRDNEDTIYDLLGTIFGGMSGRSAYELAINVDETPDTMILWIDENLPGAYRNYDDLARAYECLSRADIYLSRASRKNSYRLWAYASYMMTGGVALSKKARYSSFHRFEFPRWLISMSRTKKMRGTRKDLASKLGELTHSSRSEVINDIMPYFQFIFKKDKEFRVNMAYVLLLKPEEISYLIEEGTNSPIVKETLADVKILVEKYGEPGKDSAQFFQHSIYEKRRKASPEEKEEGLKKDDKKQRQDTPDYGKEGGGGSTSDEKEDLQDDEKEEDGDEGSQKRLFDF